MHDNHNEQRVIQCLLGAYDTLQVLVPSIPLLKRLGFIDEANIPTENYRQFRDENNSGAIMAQQIKIAYKDLFAANEYANELKREDVISKLTTILGTPADDKTTPKVAGTFLALCGLANFKGKVPEQSKPHGKPEKPTEPFPQSQLPKLGISYTINLNLPASTDIEVFNAIFKALKENLLSE